MEYIQLGWQLILSLHRHKLAGWLGHVYALVTVGDKGLSTMYNAERANMYKIISTVIIMTLAIAKDIRAIGRENSQQRQIIPSQPPSVLAYMSNRSTIELTH